MFSRLSEYWFPKERQFPLSKDEQLFRQSGSGVIVTEEYLDIDASRRVYFQTWWPARKTQIRGHLIHVHGLNDHGGRFARVAKYFLPAGYAVTSLDLPGHGRSTGIHAFVDSVDLLRKSVDLVVERARNIQREYDSDTVPMFLIGSSVGGLLVLSYTVDDSMKNRQHIKGIISICPLLETHQETMPNPWVLWIGHQLARFFPALPMSPANRGKNHWDAQVEEEFRNDPGTYSGWLRIGTGFALLDGMGWFEKRHELIRVPVLLVHGTGDRVTDFHASEALSRKYADKKLPNGNPAFELVLLDKLEHAIWCGADGQLCVDACLKWLLSQSSSNNSP